jgi:hypothetical protein
LSVAWCLLHHLRIPNAQAYSSGNDGVCWAASCTTIIVMWRKSPQNLEWRFRILRAALLKEKLVQFFGKIFSRRTLLQDYELLLMGDFRQGTGLDTLTAFLVLSDQNNLKFILTGLSNGNMSAIIQIHTTPQCDMPGAYPCCPDQQPETLLSLAKMGETCSLHLVM